MVFVKRLSLELYRNIKIYRNVKIYNMKNVTVITINNCLISCTYSSF